jgi:DNA-binding SARP family transcriptional activator/EAL domain-containing protein (putative c-di-GMP-specific phosphodiesterase class I)/FixJ family two-component response regulator
MPDRKPPAGDESVGGPRLEVRLLGPFELVVAGQNVHIGSPKQRAVLALLGLQAGKVVSSDALCDLIWDESQPASPLATLHTLISRLRGSLAGREVLRTRDPGWVLDADAVTVDALQFNQLVARARQRSGRGETAAAAVDLTEAIGLWRGPALADVVDAGYLGTQATRLDESRLDAIEDLAAAELGGGRATEALARLEEHVDANPLREHGWALLITALYRLGRQAAALRAFQQVRAVLAEELGVEPSPELVELEQRILRHDPTLAGSSSATPASSRVPAAPAVPPAAPDRPASPAGEFGDFSVIVVEDHDFQRRTVVQLLRGLGVGTVDDAANGADALRLLESGTVPDIIICDIDMPGMDGVEFVSKVAESNLACALVIASGLESKVVKAVEAIGESHGLQVLAALEKPLTARRLGDVLRQYTRLNEERAEAVDNGGLDVEEIRSACARGVLLPRLQPRIDLSTGAMSSVEISGGGLQDGRSVAGTTLRRTLAREGLLLTWIEYAVADACSVIDDAERSGLDAPALRVALNVSLLRLGDAPLADRLTDLVRVSGHEPRRFVWEIDDVVLARAPAEALAVLTRLRVKGFGLAMRHTGTGPAWTSQLDRVPLSELTLDRRLVKNAEADAKRLAVLEAASASARDRRLRLVADGCDSRADFDALLALGFLEAEGAYIAEPMPTSEVVPWALKGYTPAGEP